METNVHLAVLVVDNRIDIEYHLRDYGYPS